MAEKEKSIHAGHRERIRNRLRNEGLASFSEHEVLELLLTYAIPRQDVNPMAHELIARFGRLSNVLEADESELLQVKGLGANAALLLTMMPQLMRYYQMNALGERPVIVNLSDAEAYCAPLFLGAHEEHIYLICLDQKGHVLHLSLLRRERSTKCRSIRAKSWRRRCAITRIRSSSRIIIQAAWRKHRRQTSIRRRRLQRRCI